MTDRCVWCCQDRNGLECDTEYCDTYEAYQQCRADEKNRIEEELVKYHNDSGTIEIQKVIDIIEEVE